MRSSDIIINFKKDPDKGLHEIYWGNDIFVLCNEDHGIYDCERYVKQMNGILKKVNGLSKAVNVLYNYHGNVVSLIFYEDSRLINATSIIKIKYNEANTVSEENVIDGSTMNLIVKYTYEYDQIGRIIRKTEYRDYKIEPTVITTYSYIDDSDIVRYMEEYLYSDPVKFTSKTWFDREGHMLYRIDVDAFERTICTHKYKYNKKKDSYRCKTIEIDF